MGEVTTRAAALGDVPAIAAIYAEQVRNGTATFEIAPPDEAEMAARMAKVAAGGFPYFVAESEGQVLGYCYAGPYHVRAAYRDTVEDSIYIAEASRGLGIGGALLRALLEACTSAGFRQMVALIGDSKNEASVRLHKAAGFAPVGTLKSVGFKHGRWLDVVLMQLALGAGATRDPDR